METPQAEKFKLTQDHPSDLRIYFMIARPIHLQIANEKVVAILAYNIDTALNRAKTEAPGLEIVYYGQTTTVKELIDKLYLDTPILPPASKEIKTVQPLEIKKLNKEKFKAGLLFVLEEFVKVEGDRKKLKEIIEKI